MTCKRCIPIECESERYDLWSLQDSLFLVLRAQGCLSTVERRLVSSATKAQIDAAVEEIKAELARQQAICYPDPESDDRLEIAAIPPACCVGSAIDIPISVTGGTEPYVYKVISGELPAGLSLTDGAITGTPTAGGDSTFTVKVWDASGLTAQTEFTIRALEITTVSAPTMTVGVEYSFQIEADGGSGNYAYTIVSGALPDGITLDTDGLIHGTPTTTTTAPMSVVIALTDLDVVPSEREYFTPLVSLATVSTHTLGADSWTTSGNTAYVSPQLDGSYQVVNVAFTLLFSNLIIGEGYTATVRLTNQLNAMTYRTYSFTASDTSHTIADSLPQQVAGATLKVDSPRVNYA